MPIKAAIILNAIVNVRFPRDTVLNLARRKKQGLETSTSEQSSLGVLYYLAPKYQVNKSKTRKRIPFNMLCGLDKRSKKIRLLL